jgi:hypothetical protein
MRQRILGPEGSKRRWRFRFLSLPLLLATALALLLAGSAQAVHDLTFQLDGDVSASTTTHVGPNTQNLDWDSFFDSSGNQIAGSLTGGFTNSTFTRDFLTNADGSFNTADHTTFATGSKDTLNITPGWQCNFDNNVNSKTDLSNVYAAAYTNPANGHEILYFGLERNDNSGDGNVAFWFLQSNADCVSTGGNTAWTGVHKDGDLLLVSAFTKGGSVSTVDVYRWNGSSPGSLGTTAVAHGVDCKTTLGGDATCATVNGPTNGTGGTIQTPWLTANKTDGAGHSLRTSEFYEGGLDLTEKGLGGKCFSTFIGDTRSSQSLTATIFDYARGAFEHCGANISITPDGVNAVGQTQTYTVRVTQSISGVTTGVSGVHPTVTLTASNGAAVANLVDDCATTGTDSNGECTVSFTSNTAGVITGHAAATVTIDGTDFPVQTDGQGGNTGDATKRFVDANIQISPNGVNRVGATHTFTAHVNVNDGLGGGFVNAPDGTAISFTIDSGPGSFTSPNPCTTSGGTGSCTITLSSAVTGVTTVSAHSTLLVSGVSLTRNTNGVGANSGPATKTWVNAAISIAPNATNEVGQPHTFTVTLQKDVGDGAGFVAFAGAHVDFTLTDSNGAVSVLNAAASTCDDAGANTNASGQCTIVFTSNSAGTVTGHASWTGTLGTPSAFTVETDGVAPNSGDAVKTFVDANIQITPQTATNPITTNHTLTGHVNVNTGSGGFVNAPDGTTINFSIISGPGSFVGPSSCTTSGGTGSCTVVISSSTTGTTTIRATTDVTVGGIVLHRETGDAHAGDSADASKTWVNAKITIAPSATNEVGQPHTFTVTLSNDSGTGTFVPAPGEHVDVTLTDSNGANHTAPTGTCTNPGPNTDANGQCTITFTSNSTGKVTGHATATLSINGATVTVSTNGIAPNSDDAVKTFVDAHISITPTATNGITENHTFTVHIEADNGTNSGFQPVSGLNPTVTLTPAGGASVSGVTDTCASTGTNASGDCTVTFTSNSAGTVTGHASITFSVGGASLTRTTNGTSGNSGDAVKTFVSGSLRWLKKDAAGALLGGATFQVCATGGTAAGLTPLCVTILDNSAADADPVAGQFQLNAYQTGLGGLALGTYTITETIPPAGYTGDPFVETISITQANLNPTAIHVWVNTKPSQGCTPGFWKNHTAAWDQSTDATVIALKAAIDAAGAPYAYTAGGMTTQSFATIFGLTSAQMTAAGLSPSLTLLGAINLGGGGFNALARHGTAALLSSVSVQYPYSAKQVLDGVHNAIVALDANQVSATFPDGVTTDLAAANNLSEQACPTG